MTPAEWLRASVLMLADTAEDNDRNLHHPDYSASLRNLIAEAISQAIEAARAEAMTKTRELVARLDRFRRDGGALPSEIHLLIDLDPAFARARGESTPEPERCRGRHYYDCCPYYCEHYKVCDKPLPCSDHPSSSTPSEPVE